MAIAAGGATTTAIDARMKWAPLTVYALGQQILSPNNDVVSATAAHTSGATYNPANWTLSSTFAPRPTTGKNPLTGWFHVDGYGTMGNGTTDDTAAITAAIAALPASTGCVLYFPAGTYAANNLRLAKSNVTIKMHDGAILKKNANGPVLSWGLSGQTKFTADGLRIDGQGATYTGPGLVIDGGTWPLLINGDISGTASNALQFTGDGFGHSDRVSAMVLNVYDSLIGGANATVGAISLPLDTTQAPNRQFVNIQTNGSLLFEDAGSQDTKFSMCTARNIGNYTGTPAKMLIATSRFATSGPSTTLRGTQCTWVGNAFAGDVFIDANSSLSTIVGNGIAGSLTVNSGASGTAVGPNTLSGAGLFTDLGTRTQVFTGDGLQRFPCTMDPQMLASTQVLNANQAVYMRVKGRGLISKIGLHIAVASGNLCVGVYGSNTSPGTATRPNLQKATSGSVACPAVGYAEIALTAPVYVNEGDWIAVVSDNAVASLYRAGAAGFTSTIANGLTHHQSTAFPLPAPAAATGNAVWSLVLTGVA